MDRPTAPSSTSSATSWRRSTTSIARTTRQDLRERRLTLGENIGDLGGLSLAYRAYQHVAERQASPVIDGLTGDQRFFLAWAQVWRSKQRERPPASGC